MKLDDMIEEPEKKKKIGEKHRTIYLLHSGGVSCDFLYYKLTFKTRQLNLYIALLRVWAELNNIYNRLKDYRTQKQLIWNGRRIIKPNAMAPAISVTSNVAFIR